MMSPEGTEKLTPYEVIRTTHEIVLRRCEAVQVDLREGNGSLFDRLQAEENLQFLSEWETYLRWCLLLPSTWEPVGSLMRDAMLEIKDPREWAHFVRHYLREVVTSRPREAVVH